jgi:hypothetical protein
MELKEFVKEVLTQLTEGVELAQSELYGKDIIINPSEANGTTKRNYEIWGKKRSIENIEFEVALTNSAEKENTRGIGVFFSGMSIGSKNNDDVKNIIATKIKFGISIILPEGKYDYEKYNPKNK